MTSRPSRRPCARPACRRSSRAGSRSARDETPGLVTGSGTPPGPPSPLRGRKVGDRRVRIERPHAAYFRWTGKGVMTAKEAASRPTTGIGLAMASVRGALIGRPLASEEEIGERLTKKKALAIFSSDAISSSAYATEEILRGLILGGVLALR